MASPLNDTLFGGVELAVVGETISAITLDSNIVIFVGEHRQHELRLENDIIVQDRYSDCSFIVRYDPYNRTKPVRENLTELAAIIDHRVEHARAYVSGVLELEISGRLTIKVEPMDRYDAWMYTYGNYILACPPGGFAAT
jgi:hypothetical protein